MRRFSQRNNLVTLSDINITPLLDLAFVLLIIFVITTPLLEQGMDVKLPPGGRPDGKLEKDDIRQVDVTLDGRFYLGGKTKSLDQIEAELVRDFSKNPNLTVFIRADEMGRVRDAYALIDRCQKNGLFRFSLRTADNLKK